MARYEAWNRAIVNYFTTGAAKGSPIFLSFDLEAIEDVAARFLDEAVVGNPQLDFVGAVRQRSVTQFRQAVSIEGLKPNIGDVPGGVGFLALMVFAAYNMQEEEGIDESNYFFRLREILSASLSGKTRRHAHWDRRTPLEGMEQIPDPCGVSGNSRTWGWAANLSAVYAVPSYPP